MCKNVGKTVLVNAIHKLFACMLRIDQATAMKQKCCESKRVSLWTPMQHAACITSHDNDSDQHPAARFNQTLRTSGEIRDRVAFAQASARKALSHDAFARGFDERELRFSAKACLEALDSLTKATASLERDSASAIATLLAKEASWEQQLTDLTCDMEAQRRTLMHMKDEELRRAEAEQRERLLAAERLDTMQASLNESRAELSASRITQDELRADLATLREEKETLLRSEETLQHNVAQLRADMQALSVDAEHSVRALKEARAALDEQRRKGMEAETASREALRQVNDEASMAQAELAACKSALAQEREDNANLRRQMRNMAADNSHFQEILSLQIERAQVEERTRERARMLRSLPSAAQYNAAVGGGEANLLTLGTAATPPPKNLGAASTYFYSTLLSDAGAGVESPH